MAWAKKDPATELFKKAVEAYKAADYAKAERLFLSSWDLAERPATMCNLGLTYETWGGHEGPAIQAYELCAERDQGHRYRGTALDRAAKLKAQVAAARQADEAPPAPAPAPVPAPVPAPAPPRHTAPAWEPPPVTTVPTPSPGHQPEPGPRYWLWGGIAGGVTAVALGGIGVLYVQQANTTADELERRYPNGMIPADSPDEAQLERANADAIIGTRLYIAAGVVAAASATCFVLDLTRPRGRGPAGWQAQAQPSLGGASLSMTYRY